MRRKTTQTGVTPVIFGCWGQTEDVRASTDNLLNDYEHLRPQKPQTGRPRNGFIQKRGDHFDRFVTSHHPKTAAPGVAGSLTDIMEMHLHVWRVSRVQNAHVWRGTAPPFAIHSHMPPKALGKHVTVSRTLMVRCDRLSFCLPIPAQCSTRGGAYSFSRYPYVSLFLRRPRQLREGNNGYSSRPEL